MGTPYHYDDIKLTCPFCKGEMEFDTILIDQDYGMPYYIDYICINKKCKFELRIDFDKFKTRIPKDIRDEGDKADGKD
jgi:C4-type Zn-finger protein